MPATRDPIKPENSVHWMTLLVNSSTTFESTVAPPDALIELMVTNDDARAAGETRSVFLRNTSGNACRSQIVSDGKSG